MKPLPELGGGVCELRDDFDGDTYRLMYVVKLKHAVYVLHAFMKKSKFGIGIPPRDANLIRKRFAEARTIDAETHSE